MVEATDELRERLWDWAEQILDLWNIEDTNPPSLTEGFADLLLPAVAAVVAEARTEQREQDAQTAESLASSQPMPCCVTHEIERRGGTYVAEKIAAAIREGGNQ